MQLQGTCSGLQSTPIAKKPEPRAVDLADASDVISLAVDEADPSLLGIEDGQSVQPPSKKNKDGAQQGTVKKETYGFPLAFIFGAY